MLVISLLEKIQQYEEAQSLVGMFHGGGAGGTCSALAQKAEQNRGQMSRSGMRQSSAAKFLGHLLTSCTAGKGPGVECVAEAPGSSSETCAYSRPASE